MTLNILGNFLAEKECNGEAKQRYGRALQIYENLLHSDPESVVHRSTVALTLNNLGDLLSRQENYSDARDILLRALNYALNSANINLLFRIYASIGTCYENLEDYNSAIANYSESIKCIESIRSKYLIK